MASAAPPLSDADLVLFRGRGLLARAIQLAGRSPYSHVGMVALWRGVPMVLEATAAGVVAVTLAERVAEYSGRLDVFRANADGHRQEFRRAEAVAFLVRMPRVSRPAGGDGGSVARKKSRRIFQNAVWRCAGF